MIIRILITSLSIFFLNFTIVKANEVNYFIPSSTDSQFDSQKDVEDDAAFFLPGYAKEDVGDKESDESTSAFISTSIGDQGVPESNKDDFSHVGTPKDKVDGRSISERDQLAQSGQTPMGDGGGEYSESTFEDSLDKLKHKSDRTFGFVFYQDTYDYYNKNNSFESTYRNTGGSNTRQSDFAGILRFTGHNLWTTYPVKFGWGIGAGIGYNGGFGFFDRAATANEQSTARFRLWTFPLDLSFAFEFPMTPLMKMGFYGGPSAIGLLQVRNDFEDKHARKRVRQFGYGYFAAAKVHISLTGLSDTARREMFNSYSITRYYLTLEARMQNYANFASTDVSIEGASIGAGFEFEYF